MEPKFNIDRPKVGEEEIRKHQNFEELVKQFKKQSLKQARGDESWRKSKVIRYTAVIAGITVVCTVTLLALLSNEKTKKPNETLITKRTSPTPKNTNAAAFIAPPASKLRIGYNHYTVSNSKGGEIKHPNSSKIRIPKNSFMDKAGRDIVGDVTIEYREFHDAGDIILSGIPMAYDSSGHQFNLETAGMFEIKGSQNGEPVFIKPDKKVEVELASTIKDDRFNQYFLDTVAKNWKYLKRDALIPLDRHQSGNKSDSIKTSAKLLALKQQVESIIPKKIDSVKIVYVKKVARLPKYNEPRKPKAAQPTKRPTFRLDGSYDEFPELAAFNDVVFELGPENTNYTKDLLDITWSDVKISQGPIKGENYWLTLSYRSRVEKIIVYPTLSGKDLEKATQQYTEKFAEYQQLVKKRNDEEKLLLEQMEAKQQTYMAELKRKQVEFEKEKQCVISDYNIQQQNELATTFKNLSEQVRATRLFSISQFGIYNSDCPHPIPTEASVVPIFVLQKGFINPQYIYLVDHSNRCVYTIAQKDGFSLNYNPANAYSLCVFTQNKLFICNKNSFHAAISSGSNKFPVTLLPEDANNIVDFKKSLEI